MNSSNLNSNSTSNPSSNDDKNDEKDRKKNEYNKTISIFNATIERIMKRQSSSPDPATRHTIFLNNICLGLDIALASFESNSDDISEENLIRTRKNIDNFSEELDKLFQWIQSPQYGPDHPYGNTLMQENKKNFNENIIKNDNK